jgi:hypothetical protein
MRFWLREIIGWLLVGLGLLTFYLCWVLLNRVLPGEGGGLTPWPGLIEVGPLAFIGFIIFRGGIHLLKVAVAARICVLAQERLARPAVSSRQTAAGGRQPSLGGKQPAGLGRQTRLGRQ